MSARSDHADAYDAPGRLVMSVAAVELIGGAILMTILPRWSVVLSFVWLAILLGTIIASCAVAMPRPVRIVVIAGLTAMFVLTGARLDWLGTLATDADAHQARADGVVPIVTRTFHGPVAGALSGPAVAPGEGQDSWRADIDALLSGLSSAQGGRVIVRTLTVDRTVEPNRVAIDWSIATGDANKSCGSITIAATDRQVALDQVGITLRMAVERTRASGTPLCY
ncbi:hypothetical protein [Sphingomonas sp. Leaf34]|uniref:hypothetical protein n=1 Tax=Sphingomonas sp. Leaf34 TaxID=1736216 RepID=UPI000AB7E96B|nr:hypothetical protein [Sphingomonas sp. Leaf34]